MLWFCVARAVDQLRMGVRTMLSLRNCEVVLLGYQMQL